MPSLTSENNVTVEIKTKADNTGINQTRSGMQSVGKTAEETGAKSINWGSSIKTAGLMAAVGVAAAVKVGMDMVSAFNESQKSVAQLDAVLKSTGEHAGVTKDSAIALSRSIQDHSAISHEAALQGENMLLTFDKIGKDSFPVATKAVADWATAMNGGAIPNADQMRSTALSLGIALQDPDKGLGRLHRVGVDTAALSKEFTANMSVATKQKLILQELGKEFGGSSAAALNTYAGQQQHLRNQINDVKESIGEVILKAMQPFIGVLDKAVPYIEKMADWLSKNKVAVIAIAGAIGGLLIGVIAAAVIAIGWIPLAITAGAAIIGAVIAVIISKWKEWHTWIELIAAIIAAPLLPFIAMAVIIVKHWDTIKNFAIQALDWIMAKVNWLKDNWLQALGFVVGFIATFPIKLPIYIYDAFNAIIGWLMRINWGGVFAGIGRAIGGAAGDIWNAIKHAFDSIMRLNWGGIMIGIGKQLGNALIDLLQGAINGALHGIPGHPHINLPHFATGATNFGGGWAVVGDNPMEGGSGELVKLPAGSQVYSAKQSKQMLTGGGLGKAGTTINNYGDNHFYTAGAVSEYFNQMDRDNMLTNKGLSPTRGLS